MDHDEHLCQHDYRYFQPLSLTFQLTHRPFFGLCYFATENNGHFFVSYPYF
jgi:hypothetical protein